MAIAVWIPPPAIYVLRTRERRVRVFFRVLGDLPQTTGLRSPFLSFVGSIPSSEQHKCKNRIIIVVPLQFTSFFFYLFEGQISNQRATKVSIYLLGGGARNLGRVDGGLMSRVRQAHPTGLLSRVRQAHPH